MKTKFDYFIYFLVTIIVLAIVAAAIYFSIGEKEEPKRDINNYVTLMEELKNSLNPTNKYMELKKEHRCIMEFGWGLNFDKSAKALTRNPHLLLQDHYIDLAVAGAEVSLNYVKTIKVDGTNACFSALDLKDEISEMINIDEMCRNEIKKGSFGDFPNVDFDSFSDEQIVATLSILNSKYLSELPFSNTKLEEFLGSCSE
ncbi:hypothetical protein [Vibrio penaeicida]|uniref:hypothetical protein n=1 Tax=Vibrio penaeicida TaxID=104609 RepID=UPI000CEA4C1C|nr:hypothetical protein [Vibrio penaeicida]